MKFQMVCSSWVKGEDKIVLEELQKSDKWLSVEELSDITGIPIQRVKRTIGGLSQQIRFAKARKRFFGQLDN